MVTRTRKDIILLSINPKFAEQIFSGEKHYEFRKPAIPTDLSYVVLMENGSRDLIGGFRVGEVYEEDIPELWEDYGKGESERDRFYRYFEGWGRGLAIEIEQADKFEERISVDELTSAGSDFQVPDQFTHIYLTNRALSILTDYSEIIREFFPDASLTRWSTNESVDSDSGSPEPELTSRFLKSEEEAEFRKLVTGSKVPELYEEIDNRFVDHIIESHNQGKDPYGYFTLKKDVFTLLVDDEVAGFTVATRKRGHSVKYGPTILKEEFQGEGFGPQFRTSLDAKLQEEGVKKTYSTIPEHAENAYKYLIRSGYSIEAHLEKQYSPDHGELVFGKVLSNGSSEIDSMPSRSTVDDFEITRGSERFDGFRRFVTQRMARWYDGIDGDFVEAVQKAEQRALEGDLSKKGKAVYVGHLDDAIKCCVICSRKRGKGFKLSPLLTEVSGSAAIKFLEHVEHELMTEHEVRKFYSHVPLRDSELISIFKQSGYQPEGTIKQPYKPAVDMVFMGKMV